MKFSSTEDAFEGGRLRLKYFGLRNYLLIKNLIHLMVFFYLF
jgi:hypothetical protein